MTSHIDYGAAAKADIERVVRQARADRAETIRNSARGFALAIKRLFASLLPQAAH